MSTPDKPSELELQILSLLWRNGPMTARQVLESMPDGKQRAYTSVLSVMQVMEKKGLLCRQREGLADVWRPAVSQQSILGPFLRNLVKNIFGGKPADVMQHLLNETDVPEEELSELRNLVEQHKNKRNRKRNT